MNETIPLDLHALADLATRYQSDPIAFLTEVLDVAPEYVWDKMSEICCSVRDNNRTAVRAGHSVSKSYTAARLALWFLCTHYPSTVITTAPSHSQVEQILWREIRSAWNNANPEWRDHLQGNLTKTQLELEDRWFAYGFATRPDTVTEQATRFQGFHNEHLLVIFDEAAGIDPRIWKAARYLLVAGHWRWLAIGNPTSNTGDFPLCFREDSGWNRISVAVQDTPNFKLGREIVPGVAGRQIEQEVREQYGEDSNEYKIRILGELPEYQEGTFYGSYLANLRKAGNIGDYPYDPGQRVYTFGDYGSMHTALIFVQLIEGAIRIIDFWYDDTGQGIEKVCKMLDDKGYQYAEHYCGWDLDPSQGGPNKKSFVNQTTYLTTFKRLGYQMRPLPKTTFDQGIQDVREIFPLFRINGRTCDELVVAFDIYQRKKNLLLSTEKRMVYHNEPVKDWSNHPMDAIRHLAIAYRWVITINGLRIGLPIYQQQIKSADILHRQKERRQNWGRGRRRR